MDPERTWKYRPRLSETEITAGPLTEEAFRRVYEYRPKEKPEICEQIKSKVIPTKSRLLGLFPILQWLPHYKRTDLVPDLVAGMTVAVMHIPQGMAYAALAGVPPVVGMYCAVFPVIVYVLMGTSRHVSMGTFAVVCMMMGKTVDMYSHHGGAAVNGTNSTDGDWGLDATQVATAVCFVVGIWQTILGALNLGSLSVLLSDTLVSGFTTGAAVHVLTSQIKSLLGLRIKRFSGPLKVVYMYYAIFEHITECNYVAVCMSGVTIFVLAVAAYSVKPFLERKFKRVIPIPTELTLVILGTLASTHFRLQKDHGLDVIAHVPTGLPEPSVPPLFLLPRLLVDGLVIAIISISINISMASIFAKRYGYRIDGTQEILSSGLGNILGSFFSCVPYAVSLSRSLVQTGVGGKTQLASVASIAILIVVLLFVAPFFEPLPYCVLAGIIVFSLIGMFRQFRDFPAIFRMSKLDAFVWAAGFLGVVILDIDYGLGIGLIASIAILVYRSQRPEVSVLGRVPGTDLYADRGLYRKAQCIDGVLVLRTSGALHFASFGQFRSRVMEEVLDYQTSPSLVPAQDADKPFRPFCLVLSMATVPYLDPSSVKGLGAMCGELEKMSVTCLLSDFVPSVYDCLVRCEFFKTFPPESVFPSVSQAIEYLDKVSDAQSPGSRTIYRIS